MNGQPVPTTTYLGSRCNLGGAGGFALGMLHALAMGADWVWLADDDGRPRTPRFWQPCRLRREARACRRCRRWCATSTTRTAGLPARRGRRGGATVAELRTEGHGQDLLPGIASLFRGPRAETLMAIGVSGPAAVHPR